MIVGKIKFYTINDVKEFVYAVSKFEVNIDISYGNTTLDGKSIAGLMTVGLCKELNCTIHDSLDNCTDIISTIRRFVISDFKPIA